jgi:hypothetical protein
MPDQPNNIADRPQRRFLGSLKDALAAASRAEDATPVAAPVHQTPPSDGEVRAMSDPETREPANRRADGPPPMPRQSAAEAAREARGGTPNVPPVAPPAPAEAAPPTTRVVRGSPPAAAEPVDEARTRLVRGRQPVDRGEFRQDPVVGWLVVVGGPGMGAYRPIFEGNNTVGRSTSNRVPIDFGDDTISGQEQAYIRYDSADRSFLFVPNLSKTNVVSVNDARPTGAVALQAMDVITMGRTQLVFVPFCGPEFDWGELASLKS